VWGALALALMPVGSAWAAPAVGANVDLVALSAEAQKTELSRLARDGAQSVRLELDWNRVESQPGAFSWEADDAAVNAALAQGLEVVLVLGPCAEWAVDPAWEVPSDQKRFSVPQSLDTWQRYVREAVKHFQRRVRHWQVREKPDVLRFRGARGEYLRLLAAAARTAREVDPAAIVIVPETGSLDVGGVARLSSREVWSAINAVGLYVSSGGGDLSSVALPWAVLRNEVMGEVQAAGSRGQQVWVLGSEEGMTAEQWSQQYLLAWAFGAERCYLPADAISPEWTRLLASARYLGLLALGPELWAFAFADEDGPMALAWSARETRVPVSEIGRVADAGAVRQAAPLGHVVGSAVAGGGEGIEFRLGPRPVLIRGLDLEGKLRPGPPTREQVLAARPGPDPGALPTVYADYSREAQPEFGLYNRALRGLPGGQTEEERRGERPSLRTRMQLGVGRETLDSPWIYFDVDDRWMYCNRGKTPVVITVVCQGSFLGQEKLGFNIMYDSTTGYRFTPWQWVADGQDWHSYRFELQDANFANTNGYDFRINAKGSKQDLWVAEVTVEKVPEPSATRPQPLPHTNQ